MRLSRFSLKTLAQSQMLLQGQASRFCAPAAHFCRNYPGDDPNFENPLTRTGRVLKNDIIQLKDNVAELIGFHKLPRPHNIDDIDQFYSWQNHSDVLIIGGGVVGSSIAFFLEESFPGAMNITVLEKDPTYARAATTLSCGGLRQQFSLPENILMSKFGAQFLRELPKRCAVKGLDPPDVQFNPTGYLFLASEAGAEQLASNHAVQLECGVKNQLLSKKQLKQRFPWLNTEDVELGCLGMENEGWFDPWSLLNALRDKSISLGAKFVQGEGIGFDFKELPDTFIAGDTSGEPYKKIDKLIVRLKSGEERKISFGLCIIACGPSSGDVAEMAKIGTGQGILSFPLPVVPRKRYVYNIHCPKGPGIDLPFLIDPTGTYIRREGYGGHYICGRSPPEGEPEPTTKNFEVDHEFFDNHVWPHLAHRVPAMQEIKVKSSWAGHYDYNTFDQNAILGYHPYYNNLIFATGFSGHGLQQAPAVGQAVMELISEGSYQSIDLSRFAFDRLMVGEQVLERNIV